MDNINKTIDETTNIENEPVLSCLKQIRSQLRNKLLPGVILSPMKLPPVLGNLYL